MVATCTEEDLDKVEEYIAELCEESWRDGARSCRERCVLEERLAWMKGVAEGRQQVLEQINQDNLRDQRRRMLIRDVFKVIYEVLMVVGGLLVFYCAICLLWCVALSQEYLP